MVIHIKYPFYLETWRDQHALLFEWISIQRWPAYIMFGLISLVGLVNLVAAISMIIIEKSQQIGILYAQGFTRRKLQKIFIYQGKTWKKELQQASKNWDIKYKQRRSVTSADSVILEIENFKKIKI